MIRAALSLFLLIASPALSQPVTGLFLEPEGANAIAVTERGVVAFGIYERKLSGLRASQQQNGGRLTISVHHPGADGAVRGKLVLRQVATGYAVERGPYDYFPLYKGDMLRPISGLPQRCLAPKTRKREMLGTYMNPRMQGDNYTISATTLSLPEVKQTDIFGDAEVIEKAVRKRIRTEFSHPDRLVVRYSEADMAVDHLGLGLFSFAAFGPRGATMSLVYLKEQDTSCLDTAFKLAKEAVE